MEKQIIKSLFASLFIMSLASCQKDTTKQPFANSKANAISNDESSLAGNIVAWYPFNGNTRDSSGNKNNVTLNSGCKRTTGKNGKPQTAYYFNGSSYMQVSNSSSLNPTNISLLAVVKVQGFYQGQCHGNRIISKGYNDTWNGRYTLEFSDAPYYNYLGCNSVVNEVYQTFSGTYGDGQGTASGTTATSNYIVKDKWYTLIYTYDGSNSKLYINGVLRSITQKTTSFSPSDRDLFFGRNEDPTFPYNFTGAIDEIRIYNKAITPIQVAKLTKEFE